MIKKANDYLEEGFPDEALVLYNRALLFGYYDDPKFFEPALKFYIRQPSHTWIDFMLCHFISTGYVELTFEDPLSQKRYDELLQSWKSKNAFMESKTSRRKTDKNELEYAERWLKQQMANKEFYKRHFAKPELSDDKFLVRNPLKASSFSGNSF